MAEEKVILRASKEFRRRYKKLPQHIQRKVDKQLYFLSQNPAHPSLRVHPIKDIFEFYVDIHYRAFFRKNGNVYELLTVGTHRIVDRK